MISRAKIPKPQKLTGWSGPMLRVPGCGHRACSTLVCAALLGLVFACGGDGTTDVNAHRATQLALVTQPSSPAQSGVPFATQPVVQLEDDQGVAVAKPGVA